MAAPSNKIIHFVSGLSLFAGDATVGTHYAPCLMFCHQNDKTAILSVRNNNTVIIRGCTFC